MKKFEEMLAKAIKEKTGKEVTVDEVSVKKNNGVLLHGYNISSECCRVAPVFYCEGKEEEIDNIVEKYEAETEKIKAMQEVINECLENPDFIYEHVVPVLVNAEMNADRIREKEIYNEDFADMKVLYRVLVKIEESETSSFLLKKDLIERLNLDLEKVRRRSLDWVDAHTYIKSMRDTMLELGTPEYMCPPDDGNLVVVSNEFKHDGASAILSQNVAEKICKMLGSDQFYLLPSSIHEVIAVKYEDANLDELKEMVEQVNKTEVSDEDFLSNNVYIYKDGKFEVA